MTALAVCLGCRAVLPVGAACPVDPDHRAVSLGEPEGRAALVEAVWGPASQRSYTLRELQRDTRSQLRTSAIGMAAGSSGGMFLGSLTLAVMGAAAGAAVGQILGALRARRRIPEHPRGADDALPPARVARGRIRRATGEESPASGSPCAVWALELRLEGAWGERVMLRGGATGGLEITLDGGASARVPAGPVIVLGAMSQLDDIESAVLADYLRGVDPARSDDPEPFPPIPYNVVVEHTAVSGDRIELLGDLVPDVLATGRPRLYRDAPATVLVPAGIPLIRFG